MPNMLSRCEVLLKEAAISLRALRRDRTFTSISAALLALSMGMTSAVVSLIWQVTYAQLPVPDPAHIYTLSTSVTHMGRFENDVPEGPASLFSTPSFRYLAERFHSGSGMIARHGERVNIETAQGASHLGADFVSGNFFDVLGVRPIFGRAIEPEDDSLSHDYFVAVLSYSFWEEAFGGQLSAIGSSVRVNGISFRIIGIAPPRFEGLIAGQNPQVYLPLAAFPALNPSWHAFDDWSVHWLHLFLRAPANLPPARIEAELAPAYHAAVRQELTSQGPQAPDYLNQLAHARLSLAPAPQGIHGMLNRWEEPLRVLLWMTVAVLLLVVINVAGLMVVRSIKQRQEMLVRYALGANRMAIMRLYLIQTVALALVGGIAGIWIAHWGARLLIHLARMDVNDAVHANFGLSVLGLHGTAAAFAGLLAGILPAWYAARLDLASGLNEGAVTHSADRSHSRSRRILASAQIALSLVLLIVAGLFAVALHDLVSVPLGFNPDRLLLFSIDPKMAGTSPQAAAALFARIEQRLRSTPGVQNVSYGTGGPFPQGTDVAVVIPGRMAGNHVITGTIQPKSKHQSGMRSIIGPGYFRTLGVPLLAGREFDERDRANAPGAVIINETLAHQLYGKASPVEQTVTLFNGLDPNWLATIVGVVADYRVSWTRPHPKLIYTPAQQARDLQEMTFYVRATPHGRLSAPEISALIQREAPGISAYDVQSMPQRMAEFASGQRAITILAATFAALALLIALVGIYGVVAYSSSLRTVEFGVRMAVGAESRHILGLILREATLILAGGLLLAAPLAGFGLQMIRTQLFAVRINHVLVYVAAVLLIVACAVIAVLIPARRAAHLNVQTALRHE
jgi:putative ABC transport system permease protein